MRSALIILLLSSFAFAETGVLSSSISSLNYGLSVPREKSLKGWDHLAQLLLKEGVPAQKILAALTDPRMPERDLLHFSLTPKESKALYRKHNTRANRINALKFYHEHKDYFTEASNRFGVPASVVLSILQIETFCGKNTGSSSIFPPLARLAAATDPENLRANLKRHGVKHERKVLERARYLQETFLPHVVASFKVAEELYERDVHELRGSFAGAMGIPQFLPGNILTYGVDGNRDGKVDIFNPADAIFSTANFLKEKGWRKTSIPAAEQRKVIWEYNRSKPYIDTVLAMSVELAPIITRGVRESDLLLKPDGRPTKSPIKTVRR
jgi:membrane-bound lytic murein transglycosylase B